jgi:uncharacterized membrane protein
MKKEEQSEEEENNATWVNVTTTTFTDANGKSEREKEAKGGKAKLEKIKDAVADGIGKSTLIITVIVIVIIAIAVVTIHYVFHVSVYPFWIAAGAAYVALGIFNYSFAKRLHHIDIQSLEKYHVWIAEEEVQEEVVKQAFHTITEKGKERDKLIEEGKPIWEVQKELDILSQALESLSSTANLVELKKAIENVIKDFNKATELNRYVLCAAATSFFIAAGISFAQGLALK